ncbi:13405_t:CDS:2 [Racocetra persica]|uniref:13405_t:CDS:1 n=1 Tax=Racocetra persica TaxID=160502 RepID=A0ACA9KDT0_9GLOM|nr:13405_t:CDS:2 [Racocetra persica]
MNKSFQDISTKVNNKNKSSSTRNARPMRDIPKELNLQNIYNPQYHITELISTKKRKFDGTHIKRPPNGFFLMKNCYMLELRKLGYRFTMPEICRHSKKIWAELPEYAKKNYESLSLQSQCCHQELYPNYKFSPKKRNNSFKQYSPKPKIEDFVNKNTSAFSTTNYLGTSNLSSDKDSRLSNSLLSSESEASSLSSSPANSLDLSMFLTPPLGELPFFESFSSPGLLSPEFSTSLPSSLSTSLSTPLSTPLQTSPLPTPLQTSPLPTTFSSPLPTSLPPSFSTSSSFESQPVLNELGTFDLFPESLEGAQDFYWPIIWNPDLSNIQNNQNYISDCYVYNNFLPFMADEDNGLQIQFFNQDVVESETISNYPQYSHVK